MRTGPIIRASCNHMWNELFHPFAAKKAEVQKLIRGSLVNPVKSLN